MAPAGIQTVCPAGCNFSCTLLGLLLHSLHIPLPHSLLIYETTAQLTGRCHLAWQAGRRSDLDLSYAPGTHAGADLTAISYTPFRGPQLVVSCWCGRVMVLRGAGLPGGPGFESWRVKTSGKANVFVEPASRPWA
jgi:hypothetical protein